MIQASGYSSPFWDFKGKALVERDFTTHFQRRSHAQGPRRWRWRPRTRRRCRCRERRRDPRGLSDRARTGPRRRRHRVDGDRPRSVTGTETSGLSDLQLACRSSSSSIAGYDVTGRTTWVGGCFLSGARAVQPSRAPVPTTTTKPRPYRIAAARAPAAGRSAASRRSRRSAAPPRPAAATSSAIRVACTPRRAPSAMSSFWATNAPIGPLRPSVSSRSSTGAARLRWSSSPSDAASAIGLVPCRGDLFQSRRGAAPPTRYHRAASDAQDALAQRGERAHLVSLDAPSISI